MAADKEQQEEASAAAAADDSASAVAWYDLRDMLNKPEMFAFDHHSILKEAINKNDKYQTLRDDYKEETVKEKEIGRNGGFYHHLNNAKMFASGLAVGALVMFAAHKKM